MDSGEKIPSCLIVGAGMAGLLAAHVLQGAGLDVVVVDKGRGVGGRMATRRLEVPGRGEARIDHGAQYFTARSDTFQRLVVEWQEAGVVREWGRGFATLGDPKPDSLRRFCGTAGMTGIAKYLAQGLDVRTSVELSRIERVADGWLAATAAEESFTADALLLTPPVPQSLALLDAGNVTLPEAARAALAKINYAPCFAVLAALDGPSGLPAPGGLWPNQGRIAWLGDNFQKGISALPAVTIHATPEYSIARFDDDPQEVGAALLAEAASYLRAEPLVHQVQRWRYSLPLRLHPEPALLHDDGAPLALAGDAFAGPRLEGAALSGLAAAKALLERLGGESA